MHTENIRKNMTAEITALEQRVRHSKPEQRDYLRADVQRMIHKLRASGTQVPGRLKQIDRRLEDEAFEDNFDNMPV